MRLLIDMNLSPNWVTFFGEAGIAAVHWSTVGPAGAPDATIMAYALEHEFVLLTHDLDFGAILATTNASKPSVVQIRADDLRPPTIGGMVVDALHQMERELASGALLTIDPSKSRLRLLPFLSS